MNDNLEFNVDTVTPLADVATTDSTEAVSPAAPVETAVTTAAVTAEPAPITTASGNAGGEWIGWLAIGTSVCVALLTWKLIDKLKKEIAKLRKALEVLGEEREKFNDRIENLKTEVSDMRYRVDNPPRIRPIENRGYRQSSQVNERTFHDTAERDVEEEREATRLVQTRYATLQSPDENGVLRFSERSMTDEPLPQKMFLLEIDQKSGTGTYRINPGAMSLILSDLQMFRDFVKPFTFNGNPAKVTIRDKNLGKIVKKGNFWVVEEPLEISIH